MTGPGTGWIELAAGPDPRLICHDRPDVGAAMAGRPAGQVPHLLEALHSLCGLAHGARSAAAIETAMDVAADPPARTVRAALTAAEAIREHAVRIATDWPLLIQEAPCPQLARPLMDLPARVRAALDPDRRAFAMLPALEPDWPAMAPLALQADHAAGPLLGAATASAWRRQVAADPLGWAEARGSLAARVIAACLPLDLAADGADATPLARWRDDPAVAAMPAGSPARWFMARLIDLAAQVEALGSLPCADQDAAAWTARGRLAHRCAVSGGRIDSYAISAPTDVTFGTDGVAHALVASAGSGRFARRAVMHALDPCVPWRIAGRA